MKGELVWMGSQSRDCIVSKSPESGGKCRLHKLRAPSIKGFRLCGSESSAYSLLSPIVGQVYSRGASVAGILGTRRNAMTCSGRNVVLIWRNIKQD